MAEAIYDFGIVGVGVMGSNLLWNMADHGYKVVGYDKNDIKTVALENEARPGTVVKGVNTPEEFVAVLKKPRKIMMLVPAGQPVDDVINTFLPFLDEGDILLDGGNSHYKDTLGRMHHLQSKGIHFMGVGISGGEEGARLGPSIMPGGDAGAYEYLEPLLASVAAKVNDEPCVAYLGKGAAGHYVKMVHNGIEYSIMQIISECYWLLKQGLGLTNDELADIFHQWNEGELQSFLVQITSRIFRQKDKHSESYLIDMILDKAGAKGTGKWTSQEALDLPAPIPSIEMAVCMRNISTLLEERIKAQSLFESKTLSIEADKQKFISDVHDALFFGMAISYIQGLAMLQTASKVLDMQIPMKNVVSVWRGGCIIRSSMLPLFYNAYESNEELENLLLHTDIAAMIKGKVEATRRIAVAGVQHHFPIGGLLASLTYFDAYTSKKLPINLIQAQRDLFGAHMYERIDEKGLVHTEWDTVKP